MALLFALSGATVVQAQTDSAPVPSPVPRVESFVHVDVVVPEEGPPVLNIEARNSAVAQVLNAVAGSGNLNVVTNTGVSGNIAFLSLHNASPERALEMLCVSSRWSCELQNGIWVVSPAPAPPIEHATINAMGIEMFGTAHINFVEIDGCDLLSRISTQFNVPVVIKKDVKGRITFISLHGESPRKAVEAVAASIHAKVTQGGDGTLIVSPTPKA